LELTEAQKSLINRIRQLKKEKRAVLLCHNYQRPEIYEVADFIGDSLELCRKAKNTEARFIIFSGVYFMAESAAILNPTMKVVIPARDAGCALSDMITAEALRKRKAEYPDAGVVCYVNSTAAVKAESDVCCTSSNAVAVVRAMPHRRSLCVPDKNLANFIAKQVPEKEIIPWEGFCPIHERLSPEYLLRAKAMHPNAKIIAHPECTDEVRAIADYVVSTSGMMKVACESDATEFICTTECGMIQRMKREIPGKKFFTVCSVCFDMKKNTLEGIEQALLTEQPEVIIPEETRKRAYAAFERMFTITYESTQSSASPHPQKSSLPAVGVAIHV
jgi:quinolinate synthase